MLVRTSYARAGAALVSVRRRKSKTILWGVKKYAAILPAWIYARVIVNRAVIGVI
jgi:hypothetical protein